MHLSLCAWFCAKEKEREMSLGGFDCSVNCIRAKLWKRNRLPSVQRSQSFVCSANKSNYKFLSGDCRSFAPIQWTNCRAFCTQFKLRCDKLHHFRLPHEEWTYADTAVAIAGNSYSISQFPHNIYLLYLFTAVHDTCVGSKTVMNASTFDGFAPPMDSVCAPRFECIVSAYSAFTGSANKIRIVE